MEPLHEPFTDKEDLDDLANETGYLTPVYYARLRGIKPQQVFYWIRSKKLEAEHCKCGRRIIRVQAADEILQKTQKERRPGLAQ